MQFLIKFQKFYSYKYKYHISFEKKYVILKQFGNTGVMLSSASISLHSNFVDPHHNGPRFRTNRLYL